MKTDSLLKRLRDSEALYKLVVNKSPNLIMIHIDEKIVFANDAMVELAGGPGKRIIGKKIWSMLKDPVILWKNYLLGELFPSPEHMNEEIEIQATIGEGDTRNFILRSSRIRYHSRDAVMSILTDITQTMNIEKLLLSKTIETEEVDRKRFAADLHDDLGPILSTIKLHLALIKKKESDENQKADIGICEELLQEAIEKMSLVANNLMPRLIENHGLEAALKSFCKAVSKEGLFTVELDSGLNDTRFPGEIELHFYRIITELVNNTIKHSGAKKAVIRLSYSNNVLTLVYADSGKGYNFEDSMNKSAGRGLANIFHRVNLIHGQLEIIAKKHGTEVQLRKIISQTGISV